MSDVHVDPRSVSQSSKRFTREHSVCSQRKKISKSHSIDKTLESLTNLIKRAEALREEKQKEKHKDTYRVEQDQVKQILWEDGYKDDDDVFMQAMNLTLDDKRCRAFLELSTKEGRLKWM
jgi:cupin superfamily acireductone dioxygenase involved in methionine salvage